VLFWQVTSKAEPVSYILEALKKAELQRDIGQVPGIGSEHEKARRRASGKWLGVAVVFLALNLVLLAWLLWPVAGPEADKGFHTGLTPPDPDTRETVQARSSAPDTVPAFETPVRSRSVVSGQLPVAPPVLSHTAPVLSAPVVELPAPVESPVVEPAPVVPPPAEEAPGDAIYSLPVWPQIPSHLFQQLRGGIRLDVHVYSELPQDRFVLINLQKYHVGD